LQVFFLFSILQRYMSFKILKLNFKKWGLYYNINYYKYNQFNYNASVYFEIDVIEDVINFII